MTARVKVSLSVVFIVVAGWLLWPHYQTFEAPQERENRAQEIRKAREVVTSIDLHSLERYRAVKEGHILAVIGVTPTRCMGCLNEIDRWAEIVNHSIDDNVRHSVKHITFLLTKDSLETIWFRNATDLPEPVIASQDTAFFHRLGRWGRSYLQQFIAFIDVQSENVFYRVRIPNSVTPRQRKLQIMKDMYAHLNSMNEELAISR